MSLPMFSVEIPIVGSASSSQEKEAARKGALGQTSCIPKSFY